MKVLFAPDWRQGVPYQRLLAEALANCDVHVEFPQGTRRVLPLYRMVRDQHCDVLHLHWPEAYWTERGGRLDPFRPLRHPVDLQLARLHQPIVYTAHNLWPHNVHHTPPIRTAVQATLRLADRIFVHSQGALEELGRTFAVDPARCAVIPHGDLSIDLGPPSTPAEARAALKIATNRPLALLFGRVEPYKGIEEVVTWWKEHRPDVQLAIVGEPYCPEYGDALAQHIGEDNGILWHPQRVTEAELGLLLSAASVCVFNYRQIFTSGAASLARSWGVPILLPARLTTIDLSEPSPFVVRFQEMQEDFADKLRQALAVRPDYAAAQAWREQISWTTIARQCTEQYHKVLAH